MVCPGYLLVFFGNTVASRVEGLTCADLAVQIKQVRLVQAGGVFLRLDFLLRLLRRLRRLCRDLRHLGGRLQLRGGDGKGELKHSAALKHTA